MPRTAPKISTTQIQWNLDNIYCLAGNFAQRYPRSKYRKVAKLIGKVCKRADILVKLLQCRRLHVTSTGTVVFPMQTPQGKLYLIAPRVAYVCFHKKGDALHVKAGDLARGMPADDLSPLCDRTIITEFMSSIKSARDIHMHGITDNALDTFGLRDGQLDIAFLCL